MLAKTDSFALQGIAGYKVDIQLDINNGIPSFEIVGLPDTAVKEARERVRSAIKNSGFAYPTKKITVNLAPADTKKEGAVFDLAIAVAILRASEQLPQADKEDFIFLGELSLDGCLRKIKGVLPLLITGLQMGFTKYIVPSENAKEASFVKGVEVFALSSLSEVAKFLGKEGQFLKVNYNEFKSNDQTEKGIYDFTDVKGQSVAKRALEIAVAGNHNIIMVGPPGAGKTMLAKCVPTIMPKMSFDEAIEVTKIHSIAGTLDSTEGIVSLRPFRSPHHTATTAALTGGGSNSRPGEISLAHNGVLFLDEMPEYDRKTLETLRQPLEDGIVVISRVRQTVCYPANFMLIASMNPCPCGNFGSKNNECKCSDNEIRRYLGKLSAPLLDRIDLQVEVDGISYTQLRAKTEEECSASIKARIEKARAIQAQRYKHLSIFTNADMSNQMITRFCKIDDGCEKLLEAAFKKLNLSARAGTRILKVARTIADLEGAKDIGVQHIAEAIQYRSIDRKYWER